MTMQSTSPLGVGRCCRIAAVALAAISVVGTSAKAAKQWDGDNPSGNFSFNNNWYGDTQPNWSFADGNLEFNYSNNASQTSLYFDYGGWRDTSDIYWNSTFPKSMVLSSDGNGLNFTQRLENQSTFAQTVAMPTSGGKNGVSVIELNPVFGNLTLSGTIYNDNSVDYIVYGSATATVTTLTLNTPLGPNATQANVDFTVPAGRNTLVNIAASQVWAGTTTVNSGSFVTGGGVTLASPTIVVGGGTFATSSANTFVDSAAITVNSGKLSIGGSDTIGILAGAGGTVALESNVLTVAGGGNSSFAGAITGSGSFRKQGSGRLDLTGNSSAYAGATLVQAGELSVGNALGGSVEVSLNAILSGTGTIGGNVSVAGTQTPGGTGAVGTQTINGNLSYASGSILSWDLLANNASIGSYDQISVPNGNLTFSGSTTVAMSFDGAGSAVAWSNSFWNVSRSWMIQDLGTGVTNNVNNLSISTQNWLDSTGAAFNTVRPGATFSVTQQGQDVMITYVPEPSMLVLLGGGLAGIARMVRSRRRAA